MNFITFKQSLSVLPGFSLSDIYKLDSSFHRSRLTEWQRHHYIQKLKNGFYVFTDFVRTDTDLYAIASRLYLHSYISTQSALSYYGILPESVYGITCVSTLKTMTIQTPVATFIYQHIKPSLNFGYVLRSHKGEQFKMADLEKAILDYFYFHPVANEFEFESIRFNRTELKCRINIQKLTTYLQLYRNKALEKRIQHFIAWVSPC